MTRIQFLGDIVHVLPTPPNVRMFCCWKTRKKSSRVRESWIFYFSTFFSTLSPLIGHPPFRRSEIEETRFFFFAQVKSGSGKRHVIIFLISRSIKRWNKNQPISIVSHLGEELHSYAQTTCNHNNIFLFSCLDDFFAPQWFNLWHLWSSERNGARDMKKRA